MGDGHAPTHGTSGSSVADEALARAMWTAGARNPQVARALGITEAQARCLRDRCGVAGAPQGRPYGSGTAPVWTEERDGALIRARLLGLSNEAIASAMGMHTCAVGQRVHKIALALRGPGGAKLAQRFAGVLERVGEALAADRVGFAQAMIEAELAAMKRAGVDR